MASTVADARITGTAINLEWMTEIGVEPVEWPDQGREWQTWLHRCVNEGGVLRSAGSRYDDTTAPYLLFHATIGGEPCPVYLLVAPLAEGGILLVVGGDEEADQAVVDAWVAAARCATERLGSPGQEFGRSAIMGHSPIRVGGTGFELEGE